MGRERQTLKPVIKCSIHNDHQERSARQEVKLPRKVWGQTQQDKKFLCAKGLGLGPVQATKELGHLKNRRWHNHFRALLTSASVLFNQRRAKKRSSRRGIILMTLFLLYFKKILFGSWSVNFMHYKKIHCPKKVHFRSFYILIPYASCKLLSLTQYIWHPLACIKHVI